MITYKDLFVDSAIIENNEYFTFYQNDDILQSYDRNMMKLHFNPYLEEFQILESYQKEVHDDLNQKFLKFYWPQDQGIYSEVIEYLGENGYRMGKTALLTVNPEKFLSRNKIDDSRITIEKVNDSNLDDFLAINKIDDIKYGEIYAEQKQSYLQILFQDDLVELFIVYYDGQAAGIFHKKIYNNFFEIDDVFVPEEFRLKGIATAMQRFVMKDAIANSKFVALLSDAEDTPFTMYIRQGYETVATQIMIQKEYQDSL